MPTLNTETAKAKRAQREAPANPADLLKEVVEANPRDTTDGIYEKFKDRLLDIDNEVHLDIVIMSWFGPVYSKLTAPKVDVREHERRLAQKRAEKEADKDAMMGTIRANMTKIVLSDMVLPHGKAVKDSTGRECAQLGPKVGEWLSRVAGELRPNQVVGKALSEDRLQELYAA